MRSLWGNVEVINAQVSELKTRLNERVVVFMNASGSASEPTRDGTGDS